MSALRKAIAAAIFDPGLTEGYRGDRTLTEWQTDAVMRVLEARIRVKDEALAAAPRPNGEGARADPVEYMDWFFKVRGTALADQPAVASDAICVKCASQQEGPVPPECTCGERQIP